MDTTMDSADSAVTTLAAQMALDTTLAPAPDTTREERDRRRQAAGVNPGELKELRDRHQEMLRLKHTGHSNKDIADVLGVTPTCVSVTLRSRLAQDRLEELHAAADERAQDVHEYIQSQLFNSMKVLGDIANGTTPAHLREQMKACAEVLDRGGVGKVTRTDLTVSQGYMNHVGLELIKERARELGFLGDGGASEASPAPIDVTPVEALA